MINCTDLINSYRAKLAFLSTFWTLGEDFLGLRKDFPTFRKIANSVNKTIEAVFGDQPNLTIMAEPGEHSNNLDYFN